MPSHQPHDPLPGDALAASLLDASPDALLVVGPDLRCLAANAAAGERMHVAAPALVGRRVEDAFPDGHGQKLAIHVQGVVDSGRGLTVVDEVGGCRIESRLVPVAGTDGRAAAVAIHQRDVTAEHARETALRSSDLLLRTRVELSDLSVTATLDEVIQAALDASERLTGSTIGFFHFVDQDQQHLLLQTWSTNTLAKMCTAEGKGHHYPVADAGVWTDCLASLAPVIHNDYASLPHRKGMPEGHAPVTRELTVPLLRAGRVVAIVGVGNKAEDYDQADVTAVETLAAMAIDIIDRKRAEERLRDSEVRARQLREEMQRFLSLSPVVIYALRVERDQLPLIWVSGNLEALTGFVAEDGAVEGWWESRIHPDDRPRILELQPRVLEVRLLSQEFRFQRKDGTYIWIRDQKRLVRDADGVPAEVIGSWSDVTREVQLQSDLRQSQKMDAVGRLSGGIAHDFNNLLTVIQMQTEALLDSRGLSDAQREALQDIAGAAERSANLTRQLLLFSRRHSPCLRQVDLNEVVAQTASLLRRIVGEDVQVHLRCCAQPLAIQADQGMLDQVVLNLAVNARDAMPTGGGLFIETHFASLDGPEDLERGRAGAFACLLLRDTGTGIPRENLPRIFEPFFTTKDVGKGTGLGLATVFGIVEQHGGWIDVDSELGSGTSFRIYLPCAPVVDESVAGEARPPLSIGGTETLLVVEDERALQRLLQSALSPLGYVVLTASSGPEALETWRAHRRRVNLLVTDLVMPGGMTGVDLVRALRLDEPRLPVVCISGYSPKLEEARMGLGEGVTFLAKPFSARALADVVRASLDASPR
jgi:two-component system, cell cycle sensor histidine kinase and response regulator CckA